MPKRAEKMSLIIAAWCKEFTFDLERFAVFRTLDAHLPFAAVIRLLSPDVLRHAEGFENTVAGHGILGTEVEHTRFPVRRRELDRIRAGGHIAQFAIDEVVQFGNAILTERCDQCRL